jgi:UDP-N-acetylmuramoylalanine--D-glutamate ligase
VGDVELFARQASAPVLAVTGSNGKSTVVELMGELARGQGVSVAVGGNIGTPVLELLSEPEPELYVLELSSFQLETTHTLNAVASALLNVSPDHMDRYPDLDSYAAAKRRVFRGDGVMVVNRDDPLVSTMVEAGRRVLGFTLGRPEGEDFGLSMQDGRAWLAQGDRALMAEDELGLAGRHNTANALAALALGHVAGLVLEPMLDVLRRFRGLAHRCQWVARLDGVDWYNDSKGTNVGATVAAIQGLVPANKLVLIAGGDGKGADFSPLGQAVGERVRAAVLMGRDAPRLESALADVIPVKRAGSMADAVHQAREIARPGDAVLLSPACASLDMFSSYIARGESFVAALKEEGRR